MGAINVLDLELQRLIHVGLLTKGMNFCIRPNPAVLLTFCNRLEGRTMYAEITSEPMRSPSEAFRMVITEEVDGQEPELVSTYPHSSLEHLLRVGRGVLCYHGTDRKTTKKAEKAVVTVRVDEELRRAFDAAVEATGESQAVVMRQLMRFFVGKGPDPRMIG
ncbi:ribbon-helix-helix domain-containing protein [Massilia arenae]|uniref:Ribbon-helix-helix protein, CopG family n=1 Tax=Massilia arenae TaxID=2603288 RepID=A0A5C7FSU6_9BURK|nr:ribbon-helix-helix domain-containing protein [Massilia arenae]TXF99203.1 ribbon-helix-helix protein, CopG family [Massilia arenae]